MNYFRSYPVKLKKITMLLNIGVCALFILSGCSPTGNSTSESANTQSQAVSVQKAQETDVPNKPVGAKTNLSGTFKLFKIYTDGSSPDNHYIPSGWMGDYGDLKYNDKYLENPHSGSSSIQIVYNGQATQGARWAGIYWQNPPNNWGTRPGGYDLTGAKKLTFWARGDKGGERIEEFKIGGITGEYADSDVAGIGPVVLTKDWQQYTIDLEGKDLSSISGGFCWATNLDVNPEGATFYLDDIRYE
jgi:hypothetical protein